MHLSARLHDHSHWPSSAAVLVTTEKDVIVMGLCIEGDRRGSERGECRHLAILAVGV